MNISTFYYIGPINPNNLPYLQEGEPPLDVRIADFVGNFFYYRLPIFLHRVEEKYGLKVDKCYLKGSVVPIIIKLASEPKGGINDIDLHIIFVKKNSGQQQASENSFSYIDSEIICAVHKMSLLWLKVKEDKKTRPPLCRPHLGYSNVQLTNPCTVRSCSIDLSLTFKQPNFEIGTPDAIFTKDGFQISVNYAKNGAVSFELDQSAFISKFSSLANSLGLYDKKFFTASSEHIAQISNSFLFLILSEMKGWTFLTKAEINDPNSILYINKGLESLKFFSFIQFINQYRNDLDNMKLAHSLNNFINNHMPQNINQAVVLLDNILTMSFKYCEEPDADFIIAKKIVLNIASCVLYLAIFKSAEPEITELKEKIQGASGTFKAIEERKIKMVHKNEGGQLIDYARDVPPPFVPEPEPENKIQDEEEVELTPKHPLENIQNLEDLIQKASFSQEMSIVDKSQLFVNLLYKSQESNFEYVFKVNLETHINELLSALQAAKEEEQSLNLSVAFLNFINHHNDLNQPANRSKCSQFITEYILKLLSQSGGKKGRQLNKIDRTYQSLPKENQTVFLDSICAGYVPFHHLMGEHKAHLLLRWIMFQSGALTVHMLKTSEQALKVLPGTMKEIFVKRTAHKEMDQEAKSFWEEMCIPKPQEPQVQQEATPPPLPEPIVEPLVYSPKDLKILDIQIKFLTTLISQKKSIKALNQIQQIEKQLSESRIKPALRKEFQSKIKNSRKVISEMFCEELKNKSILNPEEVYPLYKSYFEASGNDLTGAGYSILAGQCIIEAKYPLGVLYLVKTLSTLIQGYNDINEFFDRTRARKLLHPAILRTEKMIARLYQAIKVSNIWSNEVKECIGRLSKLITTANLQKIVSESDNYNLNVASNNLAEIVLPISDWEDPTIECHKNLLLEVVDFPQIEASKNLFLDLERVSLILLQKAFEMDHAESTFTMLCHLSEVLVENQPQEEKRISEIVLLSYFDLPKNEWIIRFNSPNIHFYLGKILHLYQNTTINFQFLASLHMAMAIKKYADNPQGCLHLNILEAKNIFDRIYKICLKNFQGTNFIVNLMNINKDLTGLITQIEKKRSKTFPPQSYQDIHEIQGFAAALHQKFNFRTNLNQEDEKKDSL